MNGYKYILFYVIVICSLIVSIVFIISGGRKLKMKVGITELPNDNDHLGEFYFTY
jgi:hypothetical protein